jgi:hypothetical protein
MTSIPVCGAGCYIILVSKQRLGGGVRIVRNILYGN